MRDSFISRNNQTNPQDEKLVPPQESRRKKIFHNKRRNENILLMVGWLKFLYCIKFLSKQDTTTTRLKKWKNHQDQF